MIDKYHRMTRDHLEIEKQQYKVPIEYQVKYLKEMGLAEFPGEPKMGEDVVPGSKLNLQNMNMKSQMRVAFLTEQLDRLQYIYETDLREAYQKNEQKMKSYAI